MLAVHREDYLRKVSPLPFIGLPREELARLHSAVEVVSLEHADPAYLSLAVYAAVHHNYGWLITARSLGTHVPLRAAEPVPDFLDETMLQLAERELQAAKTSSDWRCAGLLHHAQQLALVYIVRLHQRPPNQTLRGNTELQLSRGDFDEPSQLLIDHLHAF